jgi:hypothetical protein
MKAQEHQRSLARRDKAVKLNDLKKFAENFKLNTVVPPDLVPILAKDKKKQQEIVDKAKKQAVDPPSKSTPPRPTVSATATPTEQKNSKTTTNRADTGHTSPLAPAERQNQPRPRPNQPNFNTMRSGGSGQAQHAPNGPPRQPGNLSQRLNYTQQQHRQGAAMAPMQHQPVPIHDPRAPPTGPSAGSSGLQSPTGSTPRWNPKATFTPNPASQVFVPTTSNPSTGSSPVREGASTRPPERKAPARGNFFEGRKPITPAAERPSISTAFNPIPRMKKEVAQGEKPKNYDDNGGIPWAFRTDPPWPVSDENKYKTYNDMFEKPPSAVPSVSPHHANVASQSMPYQHQLPYHPHQPPQMPHGQTPQQTPRHLPVQPHNGPSTPHHYDDHHRMQYSQSTSSVHPSPRAMQPLFATYNGQGQAPPPGQFYGQAMPAYGAPPGGQPMMYRQVSNGPQFMTPGAAMPGQVMQQQPGGQFMNVQLNPGNLVYSPVPPQTYPQHPNGMQQQPGPNGYSSPRPPAQMMSHQGSQQGHPQPVYFVSQQGAHNQTMYAQTHQGPSKCT